MCFHRWLCRCRCHKGAFYAATLKICFVNKVHFVKKFTTFELITANTLNIYSAHQIKQPFKAYNWLCIHRCGIHFYYMYLNLKTARESYLAILLDFSPCLSFDQHLNLIINPINFSKLIKSSVFRKYLSDFASIFILWPGVI